MRSGLRSASARQRGLRRGALEQRDFRLLLTGQAVSVLGDRLFMIAMPFAVLSRPGAGIRDVSLVLGAATLSLALFVLVGGVVGDRFPRRRTMITSDLVRAAVQTCTACLLLTDHASLISLICLQAVYGAGEAFFRPAALGLIPQVVAPAHTQGANALLSLTANVAMVAGPLLAGILVAILGPAAVLIIDAGTFVVSAAALACMRPRAVSASAEASFVQQLRGGWTEVRARTWVWSIILSFTAYHALVVPAMFVLGPAFSQTDRGGAGAWGLIAAGYGAGLVVGSLMSVAWRPARPGLVIVGGIVVGATQCLIVVSPLQTSVAALLEVVAGLATAIRFTVWDTALQQRIPAQAQSRVSSFDYLGSFALMPLGCVLLGPLGGTFGAAAAATLCSIVTIVVALLVLASSDVRGLRRLATPGDGPPVVLS